MKRIAARRGQSLILVVFMIFVFAGIMALTLDFGFVLLARRQMQTGVNSAAIEGSSQQSNRRVAAQRMLRLNFDDDLDLSSNETTIGAGIASNLTQGDGYRTTTLGDGTTGTSGILANRSNYVYRPDGFALNDANEIHGDMVVGNYDLESDDHSESSTYTRGDFAADGDGDAFLVRIRRTHDPDGLDDVPGVSSNGRGIPLLTGRLAWLPATRPGDEFSFHRDGTTVRATSIAHDRPVVAVFFTNANGFYPILPYTIQVAGTESWRDSVVADMCVEDPDDPSEPLLPRRVAIGKAVSGTATSEPSTVEGYVAVVDAAERIIGFRLFPSDPPLRRNDSPRLQDAWESLALLSEDDRDEVLSRNRDEQSFPNLLLGPVLERSIR